MIWAIAAVVSLSGLPLSEAAVRSSDKVAVAFAEAPLGSCDPGSCRLAFTVDRYLKGTGPMRLTLDSAFPVATRTQVLAIWNKPYDMKWVRADEVFPLEGEDAQSTLEAIQRWCRSGERDLFACAEANDVACVERLLVSGASVETRTRDQLTPLLLAAKAGASGSVEALLRHHANIEASDGTMNALDYSIGAQSESVVTLLLSAGARVNPETGVQPPLFQAAGSGPDGFVKLLLAAGAETGPDIPGGETPLYRASCNGGPPTKIRMLIEAGSEVDYQTSRGETPLMCAVKGNRRDAVETLLAAHANPDVIDEDGNCAWSLARHAQAERSDLEFGIVPLLNAADAQPCGGSAHPW